MSNKQPLTVRQASVDARAQRSRTALSYALFALIDEKGAGFDNITVREILERAGVGRTTFYSHFRSKEDVLNSSYETVFTAYKTLIGLETRRAPRLFPVAEFVEHVARSKHVMVSLRRAGLADDMKKQFVAYAADIIDTRIRDLQLATTVPAHLAARMLAGALVESIDWWVDHESPATAEIDRAFHSLARSLIASTNGKVRY